MIKIRIISVGRVRQSFIKDGESEYIARLKKECKVELCELSEPGTASMPVPEVKRREAELVSKQLRDDEFLIVLDEHGRTMTSPQLAKKFQQLTVNGQVKWCFALGGAHGWDKSVLERADLVLSLSPLTFTYQLSRLILIEQIYRALSIIRGDPYHKE